MDERPPPGEVDLRDDASLLRASDDDPDAFAVFYRRHAPAIAVYFGRRVGPPDVGAELVAETFARALEGRHRVDGDGATPWLFGIARNVLREHWRRAEGEQRLRTRLGTEVERAEIRPDGTDVVLDRIEAAHLVPLLDGLPTRQREAIRLRILEEADYPEIAEALDTSVGNARVIVHRAVRLLAERFEEIR